MRSIYALLVLVFIIIPNPAAAAESLSDRLETQRTRDSTSATERRFKRQQQVRQRTDNLRSTIQSLGVDRATQEAAQKQLADEEKKEAEREWRLSLGARYVDTESGNRIWSTPFRLSVGIPWERGKTTVTLGGDGYVDQSGATSRTGFGDVQLGFSHSLNLKTKDWAVEPQVTIYIPGDNDAGSDTGKVAMGIKILYNITDVWSVTGTGRGIRNNAGPDDPNVSRYQKVGLARLSRKIGDDAKISFDIGRRYRSGSGGATEASVAIDFPFVGKLESTLTYARGLTTDKHDNTVQFDVRFPLN
jgi:hypothetical protein